MLEEDSPHPAIATANTKHATIRRTAINLRPKLGLSAISVGGVSRLDWDVLKLRGRLPAGKGPGIASATLIVKHQQT